MNTNEKGTIGLIYVIKDLVENGYEIFTPISEHTAIDLIAYKDYKTYRVQVKYRELLYPKSRSGLRTRPPYVEVPMHTVVNGKRISYDIGKLDLFAIYCPTWGITYVKPRRGGYALKEADFGKNVDSVLDDMGDGPDGKAADC